MSCHVFCVEGCHSGHPTGKGVAGLSHRVNDKVSAKISELVTKGITEIHEVQKLLRYYVVKVIFPPTIT